VHIEETNKKGLFFFFYIIQHGKTKIKSETFSDIPDYTLQKIQDFVMCSNIKAML